MAEAYGKPGAMSVYLNGQRLGLVYSVRESVQRELQPVTSIGIALPTRMAIARTQYQLTLRRMVPELPDTTVQTLLDAHGFTLRIADSTRSVSYMGCEVFSIDSLTEAGEYRLEEIRICAAMRDTQ